MKTKIFVVAIMLFLVIGLWPRKQLTVTTKSTATQSVAVVNPVPPVAVPEVVELTPTQMASSEVIIKTSMKPNFSDSPKIGESNRVSFGK